MGSGNQEALQADGGGLSAGLGVRHRNYSVYLVPGPDRGLIHGAATAGGQGHGPKTIIDCDVHHMITEPEELFPYLPRDYVEHIQDFGLMMPGGFSTGYTNMPKGGARADVWDGDIHPANNIDMARKRHLDEYEVEAAILTRIDGLRCCRASQRGLRGRPLPRLQ